MRTPARLGLGLVLSALAPAAALAGGHGYTAPAVVRPAMHGPAAPGPRVIQIAPRPIYGPPQHALYGPPRNVARHGLRHRGHAAGFVGYPTVYQAAAEASASAQAAPSGEYLRPRATVVYKTSGAPPLWQGDAGYVAQPSIYNVQTVLRRFPLTGMAPDVGK